MKKNMVLILLALFILSINSCRSKDFRKISVEEYLDKMKAGWLGQMAGVGWGAPTEFKFNGVMIPEDNVPEWRPEMLNQQYQDDIYVEMTFLKTLEEYGFDVSVRQAGIDFANSRYMLWHANKAGRDNLRAGIAPPFSGHPEYNSHADDIDYQIEADFSGLISPGMPQMVIDLGEKFGSIMNYGDGIYGGQFVGGMYAEAFFETDILKIINAGLKCIPEKSQYAEAIRDVIKWHRENPDDWEKTWHLIEQKYNLNPEYRRFSCNGTSPDFNIDAKLNGAYIVMGLLYGNGDMDDTIIISMRCGQDSDCNPSNAAGILATSLGVKRLPLKYKSGIDDSTKFSYTAYNFPELISVCESLAREAVLKNNGSIEESSEGIEEFVIPVQKPVPGKLKQCWLPEEVDKNVKFSSEELELITVKIRKFEEYVSKWQYTGPFSIDGKAGIELFDVEFAPEIDENSSNWRDVQINSENFDVGMVNLENIIDRENAVAYLKTNIWSDKSTSVLFELASDDGIKVWLNDELIHSKNLYRAHNQGEDVVIAELYEGWNKVKIKITQGLGGWGASMVITDTTGKPLNNLKYK